MFNVLPYLDMEWKADSFCCGDYVILLLKDLLGVELPPAEYTGHPSDAAGILASYSARRLFQLIPEPKHLCVVEMRRFKKADHVGLCVEIMGKLYVTHCEPGSGVSVCEFETITQDYRIVGFYEYTGLRATS